MCYAGGNVRALQCAAPAVLCMHPATQCEVQDEQLACLDMCVLCVCVCVCAADREDTGRQGAARAKAQGVCECVITKPDQHQRTVRHIGQVVGVGLGRHTD